MRVAFDVTTLGDHWETPMRGKPLARVAEQHVRAVAGVEGFETLSCAGFSPWRRGQGLGMLARLGVGADDRFPRPLLDLISSWRDRLWREPLPDSGTWRREARRAERELFRFLLRCARPATLPLSRRDLAGLDLYHSPFHSLPAQLAGARRAARLLTVHDIFPFSEARAYLAAGPERAEWHAARRTAPFRPGDWALCVSQATRRDLMELRPDLDPARIRVAHLGVEGHFTPCRDPRRLASVRARYRIPPDVPYLLSLAQRSARKNVPRLLRAFARLVAQERLPGLLLVLAGAYWDTEKGVRNDLEALGAPRERVILTGWVEEEDLPALLSGAEAFAFPSLAEGFGLPPLEAMACGTPVLAGNATSLPEVMGDAGLLVDPLDEEGMAQALLDLHRRPALRADLAARGLARASLFTWESFRAACRALYREAAGAGQAGATPHLRNRGPATPQPRRASTP